MSRIKLTTAQVWATYARYASDPYQLSRPLRLGIKRSSSGLISAQCQRVALHRAVGRFVSLGMLPSQVFGHAINPEGHAHSRRIASTGRSFWIFVSLLLLCT